MKLCTFELTQKYGSLLVSVLTTLARAVVLTSNEPGPLTDPGHATL